MTYHSAKQTCLFTILKSARDDIKEIWNDFKWELQNFRHLYVLIISRSVTIPKHFENSAEEN